MSSKRFDKTHYDADDSAKYLVIDWLKRRNYDACVNEDQFGVDVIAQRGSQRYHIEVEVKHAWSGSRFPFATLHYSARKMLGIAGANTRHEELWGGVVRVEIKAGAQIEPIATRYRHAEQQSEQHRALGDIRAFVLIAMPDGESDGLAVMRVSVLADLLAIIREQGAP